MGAGQVGDERIGTERDGRDSEGEEQEEQERGELDPFLSPKYGGTEVYLIRHGDALPDADQLLPGDYDAQNLSTVGRRQAEALAESLRGVHFDALYTSPLQRTRQTAAPLAALMGIEPEVINDLREIALGQVGPALPEGATPEETAAHLRDRLRLIALRAAASGDWGSIPGSEPRSAFRERVVRAHDMLAARHPGGRIACFGHGGTINVYLAAVVGIERDFFVPVANTAISIVRVKGPRRMLMTVNDVCHLRASGLLQVPS